MIRSDFSERVVEVSIIVLVGFGLYLWKFVLDDENVCVGENVLHLLSNGNKRQIYSCVLVEKQHIRGTIKNIIVFTVWSRRRRVTISYSEFFRVLFLL